MKLLNLLTNSNRWGSEMNESNAFNSYKKHDHTRSLEKLGPWLDQQSKKPNDMKQFYKIAASFIIAAIVLVACTVPVQQEEEIGYMIRGLITEQPIEGKGKIANLSAINLQEVQMIPVIHEEILPEGENSNAQQLTEVVLLLPEASLGAAELKATALKSVLNFESINILPIQETVERTFFESALHKTFDVKIDPKLSEVEIASKINVFLHEHSSITEEVEVNVDEFGNRHAVFQIKLDNDNVFELKRDMNELYEGLTPERHHDTSQEVVEEIKSKHRN